LFSNIDKEMNNINTKILLFLVFITGIFFITGCPKKRENLKSQSNTDTAEDVSKGGINKPGKKLKMELETDSVEVTDSVVINSSLGKIKVGLYGKDAPRTVLNFIKLIKKGYYNGIFIHRVAKDFLIQMGDRNTIYPSKKAEWGKGGQSASGKPFADELNPKSPSFKNGYLKGTLAMANRGPNSNTSQFFICMDDAIDMEKKWTIFGRVTEGMDIVKKINYVEVTPGPFEKNDGLPKEPIKIYSIYLEK